MGREVKRVPLDFDWPVGKVWPPYMGGICTEEVRYAIHAPEDSDCEAICEACRHAAKLAGIRQKTTRCPDWKIHPPAGDGWQLWETVSEGSPITPVFTSAEELASWLVVPGNDTSVTAGTTREQWIEFLTNHGWAPSLSYSPTTGVTDGVRTMVRELERTNDG